MEKQKNKNFNLLGPFFGGVIFAIGLGISGMTEPQKIIAFLDVTGDWDPSLIFVMIGAIAVNMLGYRFVLKKETPLFASSYSIPVKESIDKKLVVGAAIFGVGWGVTGLCPGPGLAGLVTGSTYSIYFVLFMILGMLLARQIEKRFL